MSKNRGIKHDDSYTLERWLGLVPRQFNNPKDKTRDPTGIGRKENNAEHKINIMAKALTGAQIATLIIETLGSLGALSPAELLSRSCLEKQMDEGVERICEEHNVFGVAAQGHACPFNSKGLFTGTVEQGQ